MKRIPFISKIINKILSSERLKQNIFEKFWRMTLEEEKRKIRLLEKKNRDLFWEVEGQIRTIRTIFAAVSLPRAISEITKESIRITCKLSLNKYREKGD